MEVSPRWHMPRRHHPSSCQADFSSFHCSFGATSSFSLFHTDQRQSISRPCGPPWCILDRRLSNDLSSRSVALAGRACRRAGTQCSPRPRSSNRAGCCPAQLSHIIYWNSEAVYRHSRPAWQVSCRSGIVPWNYDAIPTNTQCRKCVRSESKCVGYARPRWMARHSSSSNQVPWFYSLPEWLCLPVGPVWSSLVFPYVSPLLPEVKCASLLFQFPCCSCLIEIQTCLASAKIRTQKHRSLSRPLPQHHAWPYRFPSSLPLFSLPL